MSFYWPIALLVFSNIIYHVCAKSMPESLDPLVMMVGTYVVSGITSLILFCALSPEKNLMSL